MPAASSFAKKLCLSELPGISSLLPAPLHSIVGWQVPLFHTVTLLSHFKDLQIFIETIKYHGLANMKLQVQLFFNKLLSFFSHMFTMCLKTVSSQKHDPFHPH
jgi:hypothetical protein